MEYIKKNKYLVIFLVILIGFSIYLLFFSNEDDVENYREGINETFIEKYEANQYYPINITYDQMARIYLQDYVFQLLYLPEKAYNLLDPEYRKARFASLEEFEEYINTLLTKAFEETRVVDYSIKDKGNIRYIYLHDGDDNLFIFKENGVMQYTVFLDQYTVEVK